MYIRTLDYPFLDSIPRFFFLLFSEEQEEGGSKGGKICLPASSKLKSIVLEFIPWIYGASENDEEQRNRPFSSKGNNARARARARNDLWRSTGSEEKARDTWMYADGTSKGVRSPRGSVRGCEREEDRRQGRIGRHFARPGFIAAPYIGTLCLGCRVARISTIIAGPIIKLEGPRSIARNCRFPYPGLQRFIASTLEAGNGGSPLHPSRWRINDPPIRCHRPIIRLL